MSVSHDETEQGASGECCALISLRCLLPDGFDECPIACNKSVYGVFGGATLMLSVRSAERLAAACRSREYATVGIKKAFPQIKTMGTLNWEEFPPDLPLNVWVDETAVSRLAIAIAMIETPKQSRAF